MGLDQFPRDKSARFIENKIRIYDRSRPGFMGCVDQVDTGIAILSFSIRQADR